MTPRDCPKYDGCSAPICPLDRDWHRRAVDTGDPVCAYLRETAKPNIAAAYAGRYDEPVLLAAFRLREELERHPHPRYVYIGKQIEASAGTPNLIEQAERIAARFAAARDRKKGARGVVQRDCGMDTAGPATQTPPEAA